VLILLDKDYLHRFWCLLEAYLALHELDPKEGLRLNSQSHYRVIKMGSTKGNNMYDEMLKTEVDKTLDKFLQWLKGTDIMVTNASDKDVMLKKMEVFQGEAQKRLKGRSVCKSRDGKAWWDVFGS